MKRTRQTPLKKSTRRPSRQGELRAIEEARREQARREQARRAEEEARREEARREQAGRDQARRERVRREQVRREQARREKAREQDKKERFRQKQVQRKRQWERMNAKQRRQEAWSYPIVTPLPRSRKVGSPPQFPTQSSEFGWPEGKGPGLLTTPGVATARKAKASAERRKKAAENSNRETRKRPAPPTSKSVRKPGLKRPNFSKSPRPKQQTGITDAMKGLRISSPRRRTPSGILLSSPSQRTPKRKPKKPLPSTLGQPTVW